MDRRQRAESFLAMHRAPPMLVLPNAWDVISAKIFEREGFRAIGTTSAGVAAVLGYADGERMSLAENLDLVGRMALHVKVPVSADLEAGYATTPAGVAASAKAVWDCGAVGLNLEDGTGDPARPLVDRSLHVERIVAIREWTSAAGVPLVVNARTDAYIISEPSAAVCFRNAVERAHAYVEAGADCIFVPDVGALDKATIAHLVREIDAPVNIIAGAHTAPLSELKEIGVARVSFGPRPMRATLALLRRISKELLGAGTYDLLTRDSISYAEVNALLEPGARGSCGTGSDSVE